MNFDTLDPLTLDRALARTAGLWRTHTARLLRGEGVDENPFDLAPEVATKAVYEWVSALPDHDPLRIPLLRWVRRLLEQRVNLRARTAVCAARHLDTIVIDDPEYGRYSAAQLLSRALSDADRRRAWLSAWLRASVPIAERVRLLWERRAEIAVRLREPEEDDLERPGIDASDAASAWLRRTRDYAGVAAADDLTAWLTLALGGDAPDAGPSRVDLRSLADLFRETRLLEGMTLRSLPPLEPCGLSTLLRGLAALGEALREAAAPPDQPFSIASDPYGLERHALGATLAALPLVPAFSQRALNLGRDRARDLARVGARVVLMHSRVLALRVLLRRPALAGGAAFMRAFEEHAADALGVGVDPRFAGALFAPRIEDGQRFVATLSAARRHRTLVEQHDEDWYRNPRAIDQLRSELALSPVVVTTAEAVAADADSLFEALGQRLG